jgi:CHAT domain-containing protein
MLAGPEASKQRLEQLRAEGKLQEFRYLHLATHGQASYAHAFDSNLILSQDQRPGTVSLGGEKALEGRLTAREVLQDWQLNAELVTLSACESGLGRFGGGDGPLGFANAFLSVGSRGVCLSLWKVDDAATALLMNRFYENLLGRRPGLDRPLPKAEALAEAKRWLGQLPSDEALRLAAEFTQGVVRGKGEPALALVVPAAGPGSTKTAKPPPPFAHPRYWAAFVLIGDPR